MKRSKSYVEYCTSPSQHGASKLVGVNQKLIIRVKILNTWVTDDKQCTRFWCSKSLEAPVLPIFCEKKT